MKNRLSLLFQNDSILAVEKPAGLLSVPDRYKEDKPSMATLLLEDFPTARPLHRLDFETSGILLFCLNPDAFGWYSEQFEHRTITKKYTTITEGRCLEQEGFIDAPLFTQNIGKVVISKRGKSSQTSWKLIEGFQHHSCIEANPLTGRTHQIRVHLASIGHPIVGDVLYGSGGPLFLSALKGRKRYRLSKDVEEERALLGRLALHASSISFIDFTTGGTIQLESPLPKDMQVAMAKLRQYSGLLK
jgi:23S rRNA pseudouridine955/2504/2580 synthase/23S rRNA pseudouridine1911/1915/1917 synthase